MNRLLLTILLSIFSAQAVAEWNMIGFNEDYILYVDKASISKTGNIARMWSLKDFLLPQNRTYGKVLSTLTYAEYDCLKKMSNLLDLSQFAENMRRGTTVQSIRFDNKEWDYIPPGTMVESLWETACGKR